MSTSLGPASRRGSGATVAILATLGLAAACASGGSPAPAGGAPSSASRVERGAYLVRVGACNDCHTPLRKGPSGPEPDMSRMLSGHPEGSTLGPPPGLTGGWGWAGSESGTAFVGPWGISYATNLTPDLETGFGVYTEEAFIGAIRSGKHMGSGRPILPPMPWPSFRNLSDEDLKAVYAYLRTVPAIRNKVPEPTPPAAAPPAS